MKNPLVPDFRYHAMHTAPDKMSGAPLSDLTGGDGIYPSDVYQRPRDYYGEEPMEDRAFSAAITYRGHPNRPVTIYRAVPQDSSECIQAGDWVTISRAYSMQRGEETVGKGVPFKIQSLMVYARDIFTSGDSILEWGYDPQPYDRKAAETNRERRGARVSMARSQTEAGTRALIEAAEKSVPLPVAAALKVTERETIRQGKLYKHWQIGEGLSIIGEPYPERKVVIVEFIYSRQGGTEKVSEGLRYLQDRFGTLAPGVSMPEGEPFWRKMETEGLIVDWEIAAEVAMKRETPQDIAAAYLPVREVDERRTMLP